MEVYRKPKLFGYQHSSKYIFYIQKNKYIQILKWHKHERIYKIFTQLTILVSELQFYEDIPTTLSHYE